VQGKMQAENTERAGSIRESPVGWREPVR